MAGKSNSKTNKSTQFHLSHWSLLIFVIMLWMSSASCMPQFTPEDLCGIDVYRKPLNCSYGSFTVNLDPRFCADTEVCYLGLGEPCKRNIMELRCARGLTCRCGRCMNCLGGDCNMEVWCQNKIEVPKRVATPYENVLRFYNRGENEYIN